MCKPGYGLLNSLADACVKCPVNTSSVGFNAETRFTPTIPKLLCEPCDYGFWAPNPGSWNCCEWPGACALLPGGVLGPGERERGATAQLGPRVQQDGGLVCRELAVA